jgi:hypothetical protein
LGLWGFKDYRVGSKVEFVSVDSLDLLLSFLTLIIFGLPPNSVSLVFLRLALGSHSSLAFHKDFVLLSLLWCHKLDTHRVKGIVQHQGSLVQHRKITINVHEYTSLNFLKTDGFQKAGDVSLKREKSRLDFGN